MFPKLFATLFVLALPATALATDVRVDYDRHRNFSGYKTFSVEIGPFVQADGGVDERNTLAENRLRRAISGELESRGLESDDTASDVVVRVSGRENARTALHASPWIGYPRYYWGYRRYWYGWSGRSYSNVWVRNYLEDSLTVDVIDRRSGELVYRARVVDEVGKNPDKQAVRAMEKAFKKFPVGKADD
jgi:hypothetical protein